MLLRDRYTIPDGEEAFAHAMEEGMRQASVGDLRGGLATFQRAVAELPTKAAAFYYAGMLQDILARSRSDFEQAARSFAHAVAAADPADPLWARSKSDAHNNLAAIRLKLGHFDQAIAAATDAVALAPANVNAWYNRALALDSPSDIDRISGYPRHQRGEISLKK